MPEPVPCSGLHRSQRRTHPGGDLRLREAAVVGQHENRSLRRYQGRERSRDASLFGDPQNGDGRVRLHVARPDQLEGASGSVPLALFPPDVVHGAMVRDGHQPARDRPARGVVSGGLAPQVQEHLLDHIGNAVVPGQDAAGSVHAASVEALVQLQERVVVTGCDAPHERDVVPGVTHTGRCAGLRR